MGAANSDREIVVSRVFDAPRELVFEAWTTQEHMNAWWGPHGFTNTFHSYDMRPGGVIRFIMHGPDGENYPNRITFREIVPPERIVYDHDADRDGDPWSSIVTALFSEEGDQTRLTLTMTFSSAEVAAEVREFGAVEGGKQTLERLAAYIEQRRTS